MPARLETPVAGAAPTSDLSAAELAARLFPGARTVAVERLARRVRRLRLEGGRGPRSVVVKRVDRAAALRTELVVSRWLPAVGLGDHGPGLLASAHAGEGRVWQVFEDLGDCALGPARPDPMRVRAAVRVIARLHMRFAGHELLAGCRSQAGELGATFYAASVRRAAGNLASLEPAGMSPKRISLRDRLLRRLDALLDEEPERAEALAEVAGEETLLHGDLWPQNVLVRPAGGGHRVRLIDWDRAGVGPVSYDLSALLSRFPRTDRCLVLSLYRRSVRPAGWRLPPASPLNLVFETAELARLANCLIWPAAAAPSGADWAFDDLEEIERWFEALAPLLPD